MNSIEPVSSHNSFRVVRISEREGSEHRRVWCQVSWALEGLGRQVRSVSLGTKIWELFRGSRLESMGSEVGLESQSQVCCFTDSATLSNSFDSSET